MDESTSLVLTRCLASNSALAPNLTLTDGLGSIIFRLVWSARTGAYVINVVSHFVHASCCVVLCCVVLFWTHDNAYLTRTNHAKNSEPLAVHTALGTQDETETRQTNSGCGRVD